MTTALIIVTLNLCWLLIAICSYKAGTKKAHLPSFYRGIKHAGMVISDAKFWFTYKPEIRNTLFLLSNSLMNYHHVNAAKIREALDRMGDRPYNEIPNDELKTYL